MVTKQGLKNRATRIEKKYGNLRPMAYYTDVVRPARQTGKSMKKQETQAAAIIKEEKALRKRIYEESGFKPHTHPEFEKYKEAKRLISLAEMWFY